MMDQPPQYTQQPHQATQQAPQTQAVVHPQQQGQAVVCPPPQGPLMVYPPQGQTVPFPQPQTNWAINATGAHPVLIQNPQQEGCCSGVSERYNASGGLATGVIQLIIGILCIILAGVSFVFPTYNSAYGIWAAILFYIPAGILGIVTKNRNSGVVISYLIMSILSSVTSFGMMGYEGLFAGVNAFVYNCDYSYGHSCHEVRSTGATAVHSLLAILAFVEFIVSIVGAAFCCNGLYCCCARPNAASTLTTTTVYPNQPNTVVVTGSDTQPLVQAQEFTKQ